MSDTEPHKSAAVEALAERQAAMLRELSELGMRMVRRLPELAEAENPNITALDLAYTRISRAIRYALHMEVRLVLDAEAMIEAARPKPEPPTSWERRGMSRAEYVEESRVDIRRDTSRELLQKAIEAETDWTKQDRLACALLERIDDGADEARYLSTTPIAQVVAQICGDLGLDPDWRQFEPEDLYFLGEDGAFALIHGRYKPTSPALAAGATM
jgi:hypothetical protein